jgi:lambda-carrageenase
MSLKFFPLLLISSICLLISTPLQAGVEVIPTFGRSVWRLATAELDGNPETTEFIGGCYDGRISAFQSNGAVLWDATTGGFVFCVASGDMDGDGLDEIVAGSADGYVYAFRTDGSLLWQRDMDAVVTSVKICNPGGNTPVIIAGGASQLLKIFDIDGQTLQSKNIDRYIAFIYTGDLDGDDSDEVCVLSLRSSPAGNPYYIDIFDGPELINIWQQGKTNLSINTKYQGFHCDVRDMTADGTDELITREGVARLTGTPGLITTFSPAEFQRNSYDYYYRMALVASGNLTDNPGMETVIANGPDIGLYSANGAVLGTVTASQGFTDALYLSDTAGGFILFSSSPNGDDNLYRVRFDAGWQEALTALQPAGLSATITQSLQSIASDVSRWEGTPARGQTAPYPIQIDSRWVDAPDRLVAVDYAIDEVRMYENDFPYENLQFATTLWLTEDITLMRPDGQPWGRDTRLNYALPRSDILSTAQKLENARVHFWVQVGHGNDPYISIEAAEGILEAAPTMCLGFVSAEDERLDDAPYFLEHYILPLMDLCINNGNKMMILREKAIWWASQAANPNIRTLLFSGKYRKILVPSVEDSNSRSPDLNLAGRVGLWLSGRVDRWCARMVADCFSFNRAWEWEYPLVGHPHLRYFTAHTALGASVFMIKVGQANRYENYTRVGQEGIVPFLHMLGKGIIAPPERDALQYIAPVLVTIDNPTVRYKDSGSNGHGLYKYMSGEFTEPAFGRLDCFWGMSPTPINDASAWLWGRQRQFGNFIPRTDDGYVAVLADTLQAADAERWAYIWPTDGDVFYNDEAVLPAGSARPSIADQMQSGKDNFPIQVNGDIFVQVAELDSQRLLITLVDPGYLDPADRTVTVSSHNTNWHLSDRLTGTYLGPMSAPLMIPVQAGTIRLLEAGPDVATALEQPNTTTPWGFRLHSTYPNPFNQSAQITYELPERGHTQIVVYNLLGQRIATLLDSDQEAGRHHIRWTGSKDSGIPCPSGVYFIRLQALGRQQTQKLMLIR